VKIQVRRSDERGRTRLGWLDSRHSFSFGHYFDPEHMGFGPLRVVNEDRVAPGGGFGRHPHRDMEIITWVLEGSLRHHDSAGNEGLLEEGGVQVMTAGTGIHHSEMNGSDREQVHFVQIWIEPDREGHEPTYRDRSTTPEERAGRLLRIASGRSDDALSIHQEADVFVSRLEAGGSLSHATGPDRALYVLALGGEIEVGGEVLGDGDAAAITGADEIGIRSRGTADLLLFDLPAPSTPSA
jgi:redox-sensitive bicupin YhaK (pirin superfamily)